MYETKAGGRQPSRVLGRQTRYQGQRLVEEGGCSRIAAQTNMHCWVHQDALFNDEQVETNMREAWEHESSKDEMNIVLDGVLRLPGRNLGRGWIVKQRRYGGRL